MDLIKRIVPFVPQVVLASYLRMKVTRDGYDEESERYVIDNNRSNVSYDKTTYIDYNKIVILYSLFCIYGLGL